jgi:hypothetical protein
MYSLARIQEIDMYSAAEAASSQSTRSAMGQGLPLTVWSEDTIEPAQDEEFYPTLPCNSHLTLHMPVGWRC